MGILISDNRDFKTKILSSDKEYSTIMKSLIYHKTITIININTIAGPQSICMKFKMTELEEKNNSLFKKGKKSLRLLSPTFNNE